MSLLLGGSAAINASGGTGVSKETFIFAIEQGDTLRLDKYSAATGGKPQPVVLFAFGGGFKGGDRASESYVPFFHALAEEGYTVVSTDYRTTLAAFPQSETVSASTFTTLLQEAITTATSDFYRATRFVVEHSDTWQTDPQKVVACGSSAGAITALQAEYENCKKGSPLSALLPHGFRYAGIISFAGAIASAEAPAWEQSPCPVLLFHGDADRIVPYEKAIVGEMGLWGSLSICKSLDAKDIPHMFYSVNNAGHEVADLPMRRYLREILSFLDALCSGQKMLFRHAEDRAGGTATEVPFYSTEDYIKANL